MRDEVATPGIQFGCRSIGNRVSGGYQAVRLGTQRRQGTGAKDDGFDRMGRPGLILESLASAGLPGSLATWVSYSVLHMTEWVLALASSAPRQRLHKGRRSGNAAARGSR
jgi:hypothetical protein